MKPMIKACLVITVFATLASCKKAEKIPEPADNIPPYTLAGTHITKELRGASLAEVQEAVEGRWYLLSKGGGIAGDDFNTYSGVYYIFGKDVLTVNEGSKETQYICNWVKVEDIHSYDTVNQRLDSTYQIDIKWGWSPFTFHQIINDTLYTCDNAFDGYGSTYIKVK